MSTQAKPLTARTITDAQIRALRYEAGCAGDTDMVRTCDRALAHRGGRGTCADIINYAAAEAASKEAA